MLDKSPLRSGIERDNIFWPAFLEIMNELSKEINKKIIEYRPLQNST